MTRVDEWTSALTGVGAAIAAGSHLLNGICADLVMAAHIINREIIFRHGSCHREEIDQCPIFNIIAIDRRIITSPTRFIRAVIIPAARDFGF